MANKKIPMRKCVGCAQMKEKRELIRIVRSPEGEIHLDLTGKMSGKGAYICRNSECFRKAVKAKRFERAFECAIPTEVFDKIGKELEKSDS